jgi:ATP-dependent Clp protease ATP-binding subunit ClpB
VILLDEVEKAHADVFNTLLQVLDDGRLTDSQGRTVNFRNALIIMTSNLGTSGRGEGTVLDGPQSPDDRRAEEARAMASVERFFRPEFLNRLDEIVHFHSLDRGDLSRILDIQLRPLSKKLRDRGISIEVTEEARALMLEMGFDAVYGARPLKRVIKRELIDRLARALLEGMIGEGDTAVLGVSEGEFSLKRGASPKIA